MLLVSTDPAHNLGHIWERALGDEPTRLATSDGLVDGIELDPKRTIDSHFAAVSRTMMRLLPERLHASAREHLDRAKAAPGSHESAVLERIAELIQTSRDDYDLLVFDTAPTGHTLRLLALPEQLTSWTESLLANRDRSERFAAAARGLVGTKQEEPSADAELRRALIARRDRFAAMHTALTATDESGFIIVCVAEKLPVAETLALAGELAELGIGLDAVVVNRRSPADAGTLLAARRSREEHYVDQLRSSLPSIPLAHLPLVADELAGENALGRLAGLLADA